MKSHKSDKIHAMAWIFFLQVLALFRAARLTPNNVVKPDAGTTAVPTLNKHSRLWIYARQPIPQTHIEAALLSLRFSLLTVDLTCPDSHSCYSASVSKA